MGSAAMRGEAVGGWGKVSFFLWGEVMRTANIHVYALFQARGYCADLIYRGKVLFSFRNADLDTVINTATIHAINRDFLRIEFTGLD